MSLIAGSLYEPASQACAAYQIISGITAPISVGQGAFFKYKMILFIGNYIIDELTHPSNIAGWRQDVFLNDDNQFIVFFGSSRKRLANCTIGK